MFVTCVQLYILYRKNYRYISLLIYCAYEKFYKRAYLSKCEIWRKYHVFVTSWMPLSTLLFVNQPNCIDQGKVIQVLSIRFEDVLEIMHKCPGNNA